jgi:hypothetical protein
MNNAPTIRFVLYDLLNDLKQTVDDSQLTPFRVYYWMCIFGDRLKQQHVAKYDSGAYITRFDNVPVLVDSITGRNYFELPSSVYDLDKDNGINYVSYPPDMDLSIPMWASVIFTRTTVANVMRLYFRDEEKPAPNNPYFYRQNKYVYLLGVEEINLTKVEIGLKISFGPADLTVDIDQPWDFPVHLLPLLKRAIMDIGRFVLQVPLDLENDGASFDSKAMPQQKIASVNDQNEQQLYQDQQR